MVNLKRQGPTYAIWQAPYAPPAPPGPPMPPMMYQARRHSNREVRYLISSISSNCHEMLWNVSCFHNHNHSRNVLDQVTSQHTFRLDLRDIHCLWNHLQLVDLGGHGFWVALVQAAAAAFRKKSRSPPYSRTMPYQYLIHSNILSIFMNTTEWVGLRIDIWNLQL